MAKRTTRGLPAHPVAEYKKARRCALCMNPATVLDAKRTAAMSQDRADAVYICGSCFAREYPELIPGLPDPPDIPVFGAQYIGGLRSKPDVEKSRRRWKQGPA